MRHPTLKFLSLIVCLMFINVMVLRAQSGAGSISGVVADPTGAVISGAPTNAVGVSHISFLRAGHSQLNVQDNGFNTAAIRSCMPGSVILAGTSRILPIHRTSTATACSCPPPATLDARLQ